MLLRGEGGVGKSRLIEAVIEDAHRGGWTVAVGRAYPVGAGAPYAPFQDAFVPLLRSLEQGTLTVLMRGSEAELGRLFPALGPMGSSAPRDGSPAEQKMRLFWNFTELLTGLGSRSPLLIVLEDLQWADESSLELLHFVVSHLTDAPVQILGTYNDQYRAEVEGLVRMEQSLERLGHLDVIRLQPLTEDDLAELTTRVFGVDRGLIGEFAGRLYEWTAGNSFFAVETIRALVDSGQIEQREGTWIGFDTQTMRLPQSIRESVVSRLQGLGEGPIEVARVATVLGTRVPYEVLRAAAGVPESELLSGLDGLRQRRILVEREEGDDLFVDFSHPLVRETLYAELGRARTRVLHGRIGLALEAHYGSDAARHADQLAYHFGRSEDTHAGRKVISYLAEAGRHAYGRYAHLEAVDHLEGAVSRLEGLAPEERRELESDLGPLREDLAWALYGIGRVDESITRMTALLEDADGPERRGLILYRLARAQFWAGRHAAALSCVDEALELLGAAAPMKAAGLTLLRGHCLEQMGRADDARATFTTVLDAAVAAGSPVMEARAHQAHALLSLWVGRMDDVAPHAERALELAREVGADTVEFWSLWVLAATEGLKGRPQAMLDLEEQASEVASRIRAPHLRAWAAELRIEHASATGEWERGITIGEQAVAQARSLGQHTLLSRLQVWTGLIHLQRGDLDRARELLDDAWRRSVEEVDADAMDVHSFVPAHTGRAACLTALGEYDEAVKVARRALEVSERSGYFIWAIHRLLPILGEALILKRDLEGAREAGARLRRDAERAGHGLGLAWADACEALVAWLSGDVDASVDLLRTAAEALEAVPFIWDASRIRRQLAGRLADLGRTDEAVAQLRTVHQVFARLGAEGELEKTREMFREVGVRPPARSVSRGAGVGSLTARRSRSPVWSQIE